jgi:hypothetical protein
LRTAFCAKCLTETVPSLPYRSPSEDRLFTLGWKDDSYFYGDCESYMNFPTTFRERQLLKRSEKAHRGFSFPSVDTFEAPEDDDEYKGMQFDRSDEGLFLSNPSPTCLLSLPSYLREVGGSHSVGYSPELDLLESRKLHRLRETSDLLSNFIFVEQPLETHMFCRGLVREVDPLLPSVDAIDRHLFLDYLPMLRCMSLHERSSEYVFALAHKEDPDAATSLSNRTRTTRRSKAKGRQHYFENVSPAFEWKDTQQSAKQVGATLAESFLMYSSN